MAVIVGLKKKRLQELYDLYQVAQTQIVADQATVEAMPASDTKTVLLRMLNREGKTLDALVELVRAAL